MQQLKMWFNQRMFNAGIALNLLFKGDFPPKGWTSFAIRISVLSVIILAFKLGA